MRVELSYGKGSLALELPDRNRRDRHPKTAHAALGGPAFESCGRRSVAPVASRSLVDEARGARSACVLICDITRPVPNELLLPPLLHGFWTLG